jgi:hypothetical protein
MNWRDLYNKLKELLKENWMKRKTIYLCAAVLTFLVGVIFASLWLFNSENSLPLSLGKVKTKTFLEVETEAANVLLRDDLTFKLTGTGDGSPGSFMQDYESSDGKWVSEVNIHCESEIKATSLFKGIISTVTTVYDSDVADNHLYKVARLIGNRKDQITGKQSDSIICLRGTAVYWIDAPSARYALAFEKWRTSH